MKLFPKSLKKKEFILSKEENNYLNLLGVKKIKFIN